MNNNQQPILIVGLPRSGTTWVGEVFSTAKNTRYIFEPDNEKISPLAWLCKNELHRFPYLAIKDVSLPYQQLWRTILAGQQQVWFFNNVLGFILRQKAFEVESGIGDKSGYFYLDGSMHRVGNRQRRTYRADNHPVMTFLTRQLFVDSIPVSQANQVIVKSVHSPLSTEWIASHFPVRVVLVLRNPFSLYASYKRMRMPDGFRNLLFQRTLQRDMLQYFPNLKWFFMAGKDEQIAFQIMLMYKIIEKQLSTHPEWMLISHDRLCMAPHDGYIRSFDSLGLTWSKGTDEKINSLNQTGDGFAPKRITSQQPYKWKKEMSDSEQVNIRQWIDRFDLQHFFQKHINLE